MLTKLSDSEKVEFSKIPPNGANFEWSLICVTLKPNFWYCQAWIVKDLFFLAMHTFFISSLFFWVFRAEESEKWGFFREKKESRNKTSLRCMLGNNREILIKISTWQSKRYWQTICFEKNPKLNA